MEDQLVYDGWLKIFRRYHGDRAYEVLGDYNAVSAVIVNENEDILLVKQFRPALMRETLEIPAGTMDNEEEDEIGCLLRELKEETGLDIRPQTVKPAVTYVPNIGFSSSLMRMYHVRVSGTGPEKWEIGSDDVYEACWMGLEELGQQISEGNILDIKTIIAYLYLKSGSAQK
jgi:ADP-ribose pyrophosphatase